MNSLSRRRTNVDWTTASANFDGLVFKPLIDFLLYDVALAEEE